VNPSWASTQTGFLTGDRTKDARNVAILLDTIADVTRNHDLDQLLRSVVDKAIAVTGAERGLLLLADGQGRLDVKVARDKTGQPLPPTLRYSTTIPRKVFETGEAQTLMDAAGGSGDVALGQSILDLRLLSVMCAPLRTAEETIGVLYVDSRATTKGFTKGDLELFKTLGSQCGLAIQNARLVRAYLEKQRMEQALHIAKDIQQGMLPAPTLQRGRIQVAGFNRPCDETGGDYFDFVPMPGQRLGLVIGDVSGHGIGAALFMATARALLRAFTHKTADPAAALADVNLFLERDMPPGSFMSLFFGVVGLEDGAFRYASAGHNPAVLFRKRTGTFEDLPRTGPALGLVPSARFEIGVTEPIGPGDVLLLYTDGLPEAMGPQKEMFGMERVKHLLAGLQERTAQQIVAQLVRAVTEFSRREVLDDDLTLVVAKGA
jgi:sigma-B regulation protein RsbU (phosphoserine phosphatase)